MATRAALPLIAPSSIAASSIAAPGAARLRARATYAAVAVALLLIVAKLAAWLATGSVALLSSLIDSALDAVASLVTLVAVRHAAVPADREHRFGHGKAEPLAALGQAAFLAGGALLLVVEAARRFVAPSPVADAPSGIAVMGVSIVLTLGLVLYQRRVVRRTGSLAIGADETHYRSDLVVNASVIAALVLDTIFDAPLLDPIFGGAIGMWIIYSAARVAGLSMTQLMDRELPDDERAKIRAIALSEPEVTAVHDLRTRAAGPTAFIQLHLEMDGGMSLAHAHAVSTAVEGRLRSEFPNAEIIIHQDPEGIDEPHLSFPSEIDPP